MSLELLAVKELQRRDTRNERDRLAREYLRLHPYLKDNPDAPITDSVPKGTSVAAVRSIARLYFRMRKVRELIRDHKVAVA